MEVVGYLIGLIGILLSIYFGIENRKLNKIIKQVGQHAAQSQSICNSMKELKEQMKTKEIDIDAARAKLEAIFDNMASLNGVIQNIHDKLFKK